MKKNGYRSLLRLKEWREEEARNSYAAQSREAGLEEESLNLLENEYGRLCENLEEIWNEGGVEELRRASGYLDSCISKIGAKREALQRARELLEERRIEFLEAKAEKKVYEKLVEKLKEKEKVQENRREQAFNDEHASHQIRYQR